MCALMLNSVGFDDMPILSRRILIFDISILAEINAGRKSNFNFVQAIKLSHQSQLNFFIFIFLAINGVIFDYCLSKQHFGTRYQVGTAWPQHRLPMLGKAHDDVAMTLKLGKTPTQFLLAQIQLVNLCTYNIHTCIQLYLDRVTTEQQE